VAIALVVIGVIAVPRLISRVRTTPPSPPTSTQPPVAWPPLSKPGRGYIIQVASKPNRSTAESMAAQLRKQGIRKVGVLRSGDYTARALNSRGLEPDYFVTFVGPWKLTKQGYADAKAALRRLPASADFRGSFVRPISPG
jgi:hypothetical protein